ncbi:hypothetical protein F5Y19DRAFT_475786 [Xylariaceae sp. FL1651]|nr:hypothetical protein F5Y19DRAFT_475786 [Xylariaceae sp. FL1651]
MSTHPSTKTSIFSGAEFTSDISLGNPYTGCRATFTRRQDNIGWKFLHVLSLCQCIGGPGPAFPPLSDAALSFLLREALQMLDRQEIGPDVSIAILVFLGNALACDLPEKLVIELPSDSVLGRVKGPAIWAALKKDLIIEKQMIFLDGKPFPC